jgi:hypothetical protein
MNKLLAVVVSLALCVSTAKADSCTAGLTGPFTAAQAVSLCNKLIVPVASNTTDLGSASKPFRSVYVGTSTVFSSGANSVLTAYVPTMAATPVGGTNQFLPGLNIVPTAAANTAAFLGATTPVPGQQFRIVNASGASVRVKASGGATLNGATAGGYIAVPNLATVDCMTATTGNQVCLQPVIPTPAGP